MGSSKQPPQQWNIEGKCNEIKEEIEIIQTSKYANMSLKKREALKELQSRNDIIITVD